MRKWKLFVAACAILAVVFGCGGTDIASASRFAYVLVNANQLRTINLFTGNAITSTLNLSANIQDIAVRASDGKIFGIGSDMKLYQVSAVNGACTVVNATPLALDDTNGGMTFQPGTSVIRFISTNGHNYRIDSITGTLLGTDTTSATQVNGLAAYSVTGNFYAYNASSDQVLVCTDPATGVFTVVGASGKDMSGNVGMAIDSNAGKGYVVGAEGLFVFDLANGTFSQISSTAFMDIAITP